MKHVKRPCDACPWRKDAESGRHESFADTARHDLGGTP